jgi:transcriptional regulator with XRE-family HTH domain
MAETTFRERLRARRPDIAEAEAGSEMKRKLAQALRALRKEKGLTQKDLERRSRLSQPTISRLEAPTGALPNLDTVMRYVEACDGHILVGFAARAFDAEAFVASSRQASGEVVSAISA